MKIQNRCSLVVMPLFGRNNEETEESLAQALEWLERTHNAYQSVLEYIIQGATAIVRSSRQNDPQTDALIRLIQAIPTMLHDQISQLALEEMLRRAGYENFTRVVAAYATNTVW